MTLHPVQTGPGQRKPGGAVLLLPALAGLALALSLAGCGGGPAPFKKADTIWPKRSKTPLLRYIATISNDLDAKGLSFADRAFGPLPNFRFSRPVDMVSDKRGTLYISDAGLQAIVAIQSIRLGAPEGNLKLVSPQGIISPQGLGYSAEADIMSVADTGAKVVRLFHLPAFEPAATLGGHGELKAPIDAAFDQSRGLVYVTDSGLHQLVVFDMQGEFIKAIGREGRDTGEFFMPASVAVDAAGNIYVADSSNFRVQVIGPDHVFKNAFGSHGNTAGEYSKPFGIAFDSNKRIFVTDTGLSVLQMLDPQGRPLLRMGNEGSRKTGSLSAPMGVYIDSSDRVFVIDTNNRRLQIYQSLPPVN